MTKKIAKSEPKTVPAVAYKALCRALDQANADRKALEKAINERDEALEVAENNMAAAQDVISHLAESNNKLVATIERMALVLAARREKV